VDSKMAIVEFFSAFGYMIGPVIGSFLYSIGGFAFPFLVFATFSIGMAILIKI
jgi:MFS family permease